MKIDFAILGGPVFAGRRCGEQARRTLGFLDALGPEDRVDVVIPDDIYAMTGSYFLGLFGPTIQRLGIDSFERVFTFFMPEFLGKHVETWCARASREGRGLLF
jgi:hypothetical protein